MNRFPDFCGTMLQFDAIHKSFGSQAVFDIPQLVLPAGIYWFKGANGSGKSTLLKIIAGLLPFKGTITLDGKIDCRKQPEAYRQLINHAEAEPSFPSFLPGTGRPVAFVRSIKGGSSTQTEEIRKKLDIEDWIHHPAGSYSSGMLKKLSLLMAFSGKPSWILLDEPFTTLDQASQQALCTLILRQRAAGVSFILTSHHDIETTDITFNKIFLLKNKQLLETV